MIERPPALEQEESAPRRSSYLSLILASVLALGIFVGLFFLTLGAIGPIAVIGGGVFALAAFHYIVWGWWLSRLIERDVKQEDR